MKTIRIILLILIIIGIGLLCTQKYWVDPLVNFILQQSGEITDQKTDISFKYPQSLPTKYISVVDWPPKIQLLDKPFACTEGGSEIAQAGQTQKETIGSHTYCITKESEGAAGSIYTMYAYALPASSKGAFQGNDKTIILTFSLRFVQCDNYDEPQRSACKSERTSFNPDGILDAIASSINF